MFDTDQALARAVALQKDILLLDDVFSALDPATKLKVAHGLLGPDGLARSEGMTVIFATNDDTVTSLADEVYKIDDDTKGIFLHSAGLLMGYTLPSRVQQEGNNIRLLVDNDQRGQGGESSKTVVHQAAGDESKGKSEVVSDREVYRTYVRTMGIKHALVFLLAGIFFAVALKLPGIYPSPILCDP